MHWYFQKLELQSHRGLYNVQEIVMILFLANMLSFHIKR